jgi:ABC-type uncharacterized transport system involved in gliding motility auxiliary subunit
MKGSLRNLAGAAGLLILLALLVLLNVVAGSVRMRADTTAQKLYTLSAGTKAVLKDLPRDVTLKFYVSRNADGLPPAFQHYARRIADLLSEYATWGHGRITLEIIDPPPDSDEEEWAQRYGVIGQRMDPLGEGPALYLGLVALSGAKQSVIPFFAPSDEPQIEYLVSRLLHEVTTTRKPRIGVISTLPIMGMPGSFMDRGSSTPPWVFISELRNQYQVEQLPPSTAEIPADMETVLVVHPKRLGDLALFALDQFVLRGGKLLAFVDPLCLSEQDFQREMPGMTDKASDLNRLTGAWGLSMDTSRVVADAAAATRVRMRDGSTDRNLAWLTVRPAYLNQQEISTAALENMMMPMAGAFTGTPAEGLTLTPLITAGPSAGNVTGMEATMGPMAGRTSFLKYDQPAYIALRLSGTFKTAFPEGRPAGSDPAVGEKAATTALKESAKEGVVVLVADTDVLYDEFAVQRVNGMGRSLYQLANDNINFVANLVGQLAGGDQLISLRSRGEFDRPFARVLDLQKEAQERWRQEELKLQEQLQSTQLKLSELETAKDPSQQFVITPEQKREIEQFREQNALTRRQLKEVRKNLRQDIEQLGLWVKGINMAAVPGLVIVFGLAHGWNRRRRSSKT